MPRDILLQLSALCMYETPYRSLAAASVRSLTKAISIGEMFVFRQESGTFTSISAIKSNESEISKHKSRCSLQIRNSAPWEPL